MKSIALKLVIISMACLLASYILGDRLNLSQDIVSSLNSGNKFKDGVYATYHEKGFFKNKIFIKSTDPLPDKTIETLNNNGYVEDSLVDLSAFTTLPATKLVSQLTKEQREKISSEEYLNHRAQEILAFISLPGGAESIRLIRQDPLGIIPIYMLPLQPVPQGTTTVSVYRRTGDLDYGQIGQIYNELASVKDLLFIGNDLFSYENYLAVSSDIKSLILLSTLLNLALFFLLCRNYRLLLFLVAGTLVSYISGLALVRIFYSEIYALVFAFTSTFIGFNNEYLVHLSGLSKNRSLSSFTGIISALGTTLIGFIILMFGDSTIIKQMALVSIGGMIGFVSFLLAFRSTLEPVRFKSFELPQWLLNRKKMALLWFVFGSTLFVFTTKIEIGTDVTDFRYTSQRLEENLKAFQSDLSSVSMGNTHGVEIENSVVATYELAGNPDSFHPLKIYKPKAEQKTEQGDALQIYSSSMVKLSELLRNLGVDLKIDPPSHLEILSPTEYLELWNSFSPLLWLGEICGKKVLFLEPKFEFTSGIPAT